MRDFFVFGVLLSAGLILNLQSSNRVPSSYSLVLPAYPYQACIHALAEKAEIIRDYRAKQELRALLRRMPIGSDSEIVVRELSSLGSLLHSFPAHDQQQAAHFLQNCQNEKNNLYYESLQVASAVYSMENSAGIWQVDSKKLPKDYINMPEQVFFDPSTGFKAASFMKFSSTGMQRILAIAGTDTESGMGELLKDLQTNFTFGQKQLQTENFRRFQQYAEGLLKSGEKVTVTGHSLGAALAQVLVYRLFEKGLANKHNLSAIFWNPFMAVDSLIKWSGSHYNSSLLEDSDTIAFSMQGDFLSRGQVSGFAASEHRRLPENQEKGIINIAVDQIFRLDIGFIRNVENIGIKRDRVKNFTRSYQNHKTETILKLLKNNPQNLDLAIPADPREIEKL